MIKIILIKKKEIYYYHNLLKNNYNKIIIQLKVNYLNNMDMI